MKVVGKVVHTWRLWPKQLGFKSIVQLIGYQAELLGWSLMTEFQSPEAEFTAQLMRI